MKKRNGLSCLHVDLSRIDLMDKEQSKINVMYSKGNYSSVFSPLNTIMYAKMCLCVCKVPQRLCMEEVMT